MRTPKRNDGLFEGSLVAMVTPFDDRGEIDFGALRTLIDFQRRHGTPALFFMGVAGELSVLTDDEQRRIVVETARIRPPGMKFYYGCTGVNTRHTVEKVAFAQAHGADGAMVTVPPAVGPSQKEAERYFLTIADSTDLGIGIFNNPSRLMTDLEASTLLRLFEHPNIVLHKEGTANTGQIAEILAQNPHVAFLADDNPDPDGMVCGMALGARGISNAVGNIAPAELFQLAQPWTTSLDLAAFKSLYLRLSPLARFVYSARSPKALKALMNAIGLPAGNPRLPLDPFPEQDLSSGFAALQRAGIAEKYNFQTPLFAVAE